MTKYTKRLALIATSDSLVKEIEELILKSFNEESCAITMAYINSKTFKRFGCKVFPVSELGVEKVFTEFTKEFGEISPLIGAVIEYNDDCEKTKRSGL